MAEISVIIITYNRPADLLELLTNLEVQQQRAELLQEIIVVNNASTVSYEVVENYLAERPDFPVKLLNAPGNLGVAGGRNFAVEHTNAAWMLFLDDDVVIEDNAFLVQASKALTLRYDERPLGVLGCKVRYTANRQLQQTAFPHKNFEAYKDRSVFLTSYYVGCAHIINRSAWDQVGPYPADFFYGMEEYDFGYRVINAGYCIAYNGAMELFHKESPLGRRPRPQQWSMMWTNKATVAWKYLGVPAFISTSVLWAGFYLWKSGFDLRYFFKGLRKLVEIPRQQPQIVLSASARAYLKAVGARLWF